MKTHLENAANVNYIFFFVYFKAPFHMTQSIGLFQQVLSFSQLLDEVLSDFRMAPISQQYSHIKIDGVY